MDWLAQIPLVGPNSWSLPTQPLASNAHLPKYNLQGNKSIMFLCKHDICENIT